MPTTNEFLTENNSRIQRMAELECEIRRLYAQCLMGIFGDDANEFFGTLIRAEVSSRVADTLKMPRHT